MNTFIKRPARRLPYNRNALDDAKRRVGISTAWRAFCLPGEPRRVCCSPLREDRHPSFSISADDALWYDFATGEGGDVVDFIRAAAGCTNRDAIRRVHELAGGSLASSVTLAPRAAASAKPRLRYDGLANLEVHPPTRREIFALADLRAWSIYDGLEIAARLGVLLMADVPWRGETHRAWLLTDADRKCVQARRLDGAKWTRADGHEFKSNSLRTDANHPPGLADIVAADRRIVLIAEGEPDALAALTFAWLVGIADCVGIVALTGASKDLPLEVCMKLRGRRCRVIRQTDAAGHAAALRWAETLAAAGVTVDLADLDGLMRADGQPAKDAAELLCRPAELETLEPLAGALLAGLNP